MLLSNYGSGGPIFHQTSHLGGWKCLASSVSIMPCLGSSKLCRRGHCHRCNRGANWEGRRQWEVKAYLVWGLWECAMTVGPWRSEGQRG
jgi:hypothetical protein